MKPKLLAGWQWNRRGGPVGKLPVQVEVELTGFILVS